MTTAEVLSRCRVLGIQLSARGEAIVWEADSDPPADLLAALKDNKSAVRRLLSRPAVPPWDAAAAAGLLGELRDEVAKTRAAFGGVPPAPLAVLFADAIVIGERYVREHELEAARGWDAMELLRELPAHVREITERWRRVNEPQAPRK